MTGRLFGLAMGIAAVIIYYLIFRQVDWSPLDEDAEVHELFADLEDPADDTLKWRE